jgi:hypothetical protein
MAKSKISVNTKNNKHKSSPHATSSATDSYILPSPTSGVTAHTTNATKLAVMKAAMKATPDGQTVNEIFSCLNLTDAMALLLSLPITKKLEGVDQFSQEELEILHAHPAFEQNDDTEDIKPSGCNLVSPLEESGGFRPNQDNFRPCDVSAFEDDKSIAFYPVDFRQQQEMFHETFSNYQVNFSTD